MTVRVSPAGTLPVISSWVPATVASSPVPAVGPPTPPLADMPPLVDVHVVEQANHTLSFRAWQDEMLEVSTRWLRTHFLSDLVEQPRTASVSMPAASHPSHGRLILDVGRISWNEYPFQGKAKSFCLLHHQGRWNSMHSDPSCLFYACRGQRRNRITARTQNLGQSKCGVLPSAPAKQNLFFHDETGNWR